jgi:hypothetical protein
MSWGYRTYQSKFYFSEKDIDFTTDYLDYNQFLLQEFFSADLETRIKVRKYYSDIYGSRSFAYLKRKYSEWANGDYHLTDLMKDRILSFMPKFLNDDAKYKLGIHEFMASIKHTVKSFQSSQKSTYSNLINPKELQAVFSIFKKEHQRIKMLTIRNFRFNVLTKEEKLEALEIIKYILEIKLQKAFDQIERDFNIFLPHMYKFKRGIFSADYCISAFNLRVDMINTGLQDFEIKEFRIKEIDMNSRFKKYSDKYLAYELSSLQKDANKAVSNSFLNAKDIQLFFTHYHELSNCENEVNINSTFQGEGGILSLYVQMKPLKLLKSSIIISSLKLAIYFIFAVTLVSLATYYKRFTLLIFGGFFIGIFALILVSEEIEQLRSLTKEYKNYGQ